MYTTWWAASTLKAKAVKGQITATKSKEHKRLSATYISTHAQCVSSTKQNATHKGTYGMLKSASFPFHF